MPFDPRHASQDSCCRSNFGQVDGSFFVRRKRAIVRVNESCGGDVAVVRRTGDRGVARTVIRGVASLRMYDVRIQGPLLLYTAGRIEFYAPPIFPYRIVLIALVISLARVDAAQMEILFPFFRLLYCPLSVNRYSNRVQWNFGACFLDVRTPLLRDHPWTVCLCRESSILIPFVIGIRLVRI